MKNKSALGLLLLLITCYFQSAAQQSVIVLGSIKNALTNESVPAVSIAIKGSSGGSYSDDNGKFQFSTTQKPPFTLVISSIGYASKEMVFNGAAISVSLKPSYVLGEEVVVAASRLPERILESPVSIERISSNAIRNSPVSSYYDMVKSLKGVDITSSSLNFTSVTTRGFNGSGNPRVNQFVDGMDNQAPGLNFSVGTIVGLGELDVDNMELLPGASSALYGSGGMNGTLQITSKNPFKYQGLSVQVKQGINHVGNNSNDPIKSASPYYDISMRWGKKISEKFAFKIGTQYIEAKDWIAADQTNYTGAGTGKNSKVIAGTRMSDPNYDGVNVYGDETSVNLGFAKVSRTGYQESEIINNTTKSFKVSGGLFYKINPRTEASLIANYGMGNTVYTGSDRYSLKNLQIGQYKLEVKNDNWFVKAYATLENSGDAFNATITSRIFNEVWKPSSTWFTQYAQAFATSGKIGQEAHLYARSIADLGRPAPGSEQFTSLFNAVAGKPISQGGGKFLDKSNLYHFEGQYNLTRFVKFAEVLVGGSYRIFHLNSQGTLFADSTGPINTEEYGAYVQVGKKLLNDKLKLTASARYDKNQNFDGKFTPRIAAVYEVAKDHFVRASYQNAYRFPTNQNQWINLVTGSGILIGGLPQLRDYYHFNTNPVYTPESVQAFAAGGGTNPALLVQRNFGTYKPENVNSFEIGYKALFNKRLLIDAYAYYTTYENFIGRINLFQLTTQKGFSVSVNSPNTVNTKGFGISADYLLDHNFSLNANLSSDNIDNPDPNFATYFNSPKYRANVGVANSGFGYHQLFGFNVMARWQDAYFTEADFKQGNVAAYTTIDAQVSYKILNIKSLIKLGATNILNAYYKSAFGNPEIGGLYYVFFGYNVF